MKPFKVNRFEDDTETEVPDDLLRIHPTRDARPWWQRVKLSPWSGSEKIKGKKETFKGIKGSLDL
tara:strand:- start:8118 stop:8312 length:195 start_codon:yes stop_codon:yes gene_type:complete